MADQTTAPPTPPASCGILGLQLLHIRHGALLLRCIRARGAGLSEGGAQAARMLHLRVSDACFPGTVHGERLQRRKEADGVLGLKSVGRWSVQRSEGALLGCRMRKAVVAWGSWAVPSSDGNEWSAGWARRTGVGREALGI